MDKCNKMNKKRYVSPEVETYRVIPVPSMLQGSLQGSNNEAVVEGTQHDWPVL